METLLVAFITNVCKIEDKSVKESVKIECIDFMTNCITDEASLDKCTVRYNNGERYNDSL